MLPPLLFALYLAAMLEVAFDRVQDGIYIQTRHDADLFKVSQFRAPTLTSINLVREMLFADGSALVAHTSGDMQHLVDMFAKLLLNSVLKLT